MDRITYKAIKKEVILVRTKLRLAQSRPSHIVIHQMNEGMWKGKEEDQSKPHVRHSEQLILLQLNEEEGELWGIRWEE